MATLTLDHLRVTYPNGVVAVRDFSLEVADGEFVVLVGPSGCGKSTVLRSIAGLEPADSGRILLDGRAVNDLAPGDRDVAMVFQNYALYPHMSVYKNMSLALRLRGMPKPDTDMRVRDAAASLGLSDLLDRKPGELSGGQRQRVALGRAIVREPRVFLFDEPLSNLDARLRGSMRAELKSLHQRLRTTSIYVTHDQEEAMTLGDRVVVMNKGEIQQVGAPLDIYAQPTNRFVAGFVGTPPMNFFEGSVTRDGASAWFVPANPAAGRFPIPASKAHSLANRSPPAITLGLRPQAFQVTAPGGGTGVWAVTVRVVEPLGESMDLICDWFGQPLRARVTADPTIRPGQTIGLLVDEPRALWFNPDEFGATL
ncbi:sulfate transport system ATP-binding protein [Phycisphaerales bacterium]|nr:sulfate transport system ATP-binding protein [Phycisphaerales bacterium]